MEREAIIVNIRTGNPCLDIDPIMLNDIGGGMIDARDSELIKFMWVAEEATVENWGMSGGTAEYGIRWSDDLSAPVIQCTRCGNQVSSDEAAPEDDPTPFAVCVSCLD